LQHILEYRANEKLLEFFRDLQAQQATAPVHATTQRPGSAPPTLYQVSGTVHQTASNTGRLAMDEPNLQCIPRPRDVTLVPCAASTADSAALLRAAESEGVTSAAAAPAADSADILAACDSALAALPVLADERPAKRQRVVRVNVRAAFRAPPGWLILSADYKRAPPPPRALAGTLQCDRR